MPEAQETHAYFELNEWQIAEVKAALTEADKDDFASEAEVQVVMSKWRRRRQSK